MYFKEKVTDKNIISLIEDNTPEQKNLEYKRQLPDKNKEDEKIKILKSITSFANTDGGTIIFGIAEKDENTYEIKNIESSTDDDFLQWHSLIKDRILPRINPPNLYDVNVNGNKVYVMDIQSSYTKPHYVKGDFVFWGRNNSGKYQLDIGDIRRLFLQSKTIEEQFENFRLQRVMKLKSENFPFKYSSNSVVSIHISSLSTLNNNIQLSMSKSKNDFKDFNPINYDSSVGCYNAAYNNYDGCINLTYTSNNKICSYIQIFRNGFIEASCFGLFNNNNNIIYGSKLEQDIRSNIKYYLDELLKLNINYPYFISISVLNTKGFILVKSIDSNINNRNFHADFDKIFDNDILLPTIYVENNNDLNSKLNLCFEVLWNSNGYSESPIKMGDTNA